jgi:hypothetical protein
MRQPLATRHTFRMHADHCYVVNGSEAEQQQCSASDTPQTMRHMATLKHSSSGRVMELHGTQPGLQVHTTNTVIQTSSHISRARMQHLHTACAATWTVQSAYSVREICVLM